jgi:cysteine-S-conjugate beta-lyase
MYHFDELIDRRGTNSLKFDLTERIFGTKDILPMWVADMDFPIAPEIEETLKEYLQHNKVFGYTLRGEGFYNAVTQWMQQQHNWKIKNEWILYSPGVVPSLNLAVLTYTNPGDKIIVQPPVYYPFFNAVKDHKRELLYNTLVLQEGHYQVNWDKLEDQASDPRTSMILLCSPHNPGGRVWTKQELEKLTNICLKHNVLIVSDEIHADLVFHPQRHIPTASLSKEVSNITITLNAPSKTFNLAAFATSYIIISSGKLRIKMKQTIEHLHLGMGNMMGNIALEAAYTKGTPWLESLLTYLNTNIDYTIAYINKYIPEITPMRPEATYLLWMDFKKSGLTEQALQKKLIEKAKLGLSNGSQFGPGGSGFQRINLGCPLPVIKKALSQLQKIQ